LNVARKELYLKNYFVLKNSYVIT